MKRIWDVPWKNLFITEALLPDGEIIPRSGKTAEKKARFPMEDSIAYKKYETMYILHTWWRDKVFEADFEVKSQWVYEWVIIIDEVWKQNWQANDKLRCYDKATGAQFSMDIEDAFSLIAWMTQKRHKVSKSNWKYEVSSKFFMRGHFLCPYSEEREEDFQKKVQMNKDAFKPKDIVPSLKKFYIDKKGEEYLYVGVWMTKNTYTESYGSTPYTRDYWEEWHIFLVARRHEKDDDVRGVKKGQIYHTYAHWRKNKPTNLVMTRDIQESEAIEIVMEPINSILNMDKGVEKGYHISYKYKKYEFSFPDVELEGQAEWTRK